MTAAARTRTNWWTLVAVCGATFMLLVDITIVQVALPRIHTELHTTFTELEWVIDAYSLTLAALVLTSGSLADRFGRKRVFVGGVAIFTVSSLLCGIAQTGPELDLARALQGIGGATMFATALALIAQDYQGRERGTAIAFWSATVGGAVAIGPLLGGALTDAFGWRWVFFVNLPIGAVVLAIALRRMVNIADPNAKRLDFIGLITFSGSLFLLIFGLLRGNGQGWSSSSIVASLVGAALLMALFLVAELKQERPMFDLSLFRNRSFSGVSVATFAIGGGMFAVFPYITFYLQNLLGYSPFEGGLRLLPATLPAFVVPILVRRLAPRISPGVLLGTGLVITAAGLVLMSTISADSRWTALLPGLLLTGIGIGIANPTIAHIALGVVAPARSGMASGISNTFRIGGLATGIAALGAIFQNGVQTKLTALLPGSPHALAAAVVASGPRALTQPQTVHAGTVAFVSGMHSLLLVGAACVTVGAASSFLFVRGSDLVHAAAPQAHAAPDAA
ncbi:MAG TPA: MFS transporter [Gaiellaceae bacterium]|nr:MFS transporter [Gaiellaceae bacterium]